MDVPGPERRLAAVLAADMVGYSRLMEVDETGTLARLKTHRIELIDPAIAKNRGRIIKTTGDGMLLEFHSVADAELCAAEIQRRMARRNTDVSSVGKLGSTPHFAPQNDQLMSEHRVLRLKPALRLERRGQHGQNKPNQRDHRASLADSVTPKIRIRFSVHTAVRHAYVAGSRQRAIVALTQN